MDNQTTPYSAFFKLYDAIRENLQVSFNLTADTQIDLLAKYNAAVDALFAQGMKVEPAGLGEGEKIQEVHGWVLGETTTNEPCVFLYHERLDFKVTTVYKEKIAGLPIDISTAPKVWDGAAPTKEIAEKKGILRPCHFKIVLAPTGKTSDKGNPTYRFDRVYGAVASKPKAHAQFDFESEMGKMIAWGNRMQEANGPKASQAETERVMELINQMYVHDRAGITVLGLLTSLPEDQVPTRTAKAITQALLKWLPEKIVNANGQEEANPSFNPRYYQAVIDICLETLPAESEKSATIEAADEIPF